MYECDVCGLLSLGGNACPACGSMLRKDLSMELSNEEFGEVPGLDDAVDSFYEFEGTEPPKTEERVETEIISSLPFGFQGQSNVTEPGLPFGIGSYSLGMPFDVEEDEIPSSGALEEETLQSTNQSIGLQEATAPETGAPPSIVDDHQTQISESIEVPTFAEIERLQETEQLPQHNDMVVTEEQQSDELSGVLALDMDAIGSADVLEEDIDIEGLLNNETSTPESTTNSHPQHVEPTPIRVTGARIITEDSSPLDVPDYWKIDAEIPNYEEIYNDAPQVIEVEFSNLDDDVVMYDHNFEGSNAVYHSPLEHSSPVVTVTESASFSFHPPQAMAIDLQGRLEFTSTVERGFHSFQTKEWVDAAQSFQTLASTFPGQPAVFNNYGLALFERAKEFATTPGSEHLAPAQFDSSILALREAAKISPHQSEILLNLSYALFESGRVDKALGIANVHNQQHTHLTAGKNAAAIYMNALGQHPQAIELLQSIADRDAIGSENLQLMVKTSQNSFY